MFQLLKLVLIQVYIFLIFGYRKRESKYGIYLIRYYAFSMRCVRQNSPCAGQLHWVLNDEKNVSFFFLSNVANSLVKYVQGRRPSAVHTVRKHLRGRITWWTTSGSTRVSHRTSASIAPNPSRGRNIWPITCVNIQANRHTDATSAPNHLLVRSIWRIMCASTLANLHIGVSSARGRSLGKNT